MILGVTGKTGVGKHTAAQHLASRGWAVLDADTIAHGLYEPDTLVWHELVKTFSAGILNPDKTINRKKLHDLVFDPNDPETGEENLSKLNSLIHPALRQKLKKEVQALRRANQDGAVVAALWQELDLFRLTDRLILIEADAELACTRIMERDRIDRDTFFRRFESQSTPAFCEIVIKNNGTIEEFYRAIDLALAAL